MKNITFVTTHLTGGGAERVLGILANEFAASGKYHVTVVMLEDGYTSYTIHPAVRIVVAKKIHGTSYPASLLRMAYRIYQLRKIFKETDIAVSFMTYINICTLIGSWALGKRVIISERNDPNFIADSIPAVVLAIKRKLYYAADVIVFQTKSAMNFYDEKTRQKSVIIPNPLNPDLPEANTGKRERSILIAGRLEPQKNMEMAIRGFSLFVRSHPDYVLKIFGNGSLREHLGDLAATLGIGDKVFIHGFTDHIYEEMARAGIYISTSDFEGISNSMLEALAMGCPSVITDCPAYGARMFIKSGENGVLIPVGNEEALASALSDIADHPVYAEKLSKNAVKIREQLRADKIFHMWEALI